MKSGFSLIEILVSLFLATIVIAGIFFVFNQAFMSVDSQSYSLNSAMNELDTSVDGWKGATPTYSLTDVTTSTLPSTFSYLENFMKIYKVSKKGIGSGTISYKIIVISK